MPASSIQSRMIEVNSERKCAYKLSMQPDVIFRTRTLLNFLRLATNYFLYLYQKRIIHNYTITDVNNRHLTQKMLCFWYGRYLPTY